jgi:hypothetical protein
LSIASARPREVAASRVRHAIEIEDRLNRTVLALAAVECDEDDFRIPHSGHRAQGGQTRALRHPPQRLARGWRLFHDARRSHRILIGARELAARGIDARHTVSDLAQRMRDAQPRCQ